MVTPLNVKVRGPKFEHGKINVYQVFLPFKIQLIF